MFGLEIIIDGLESRLGLQHPPTKKCGVGVSPGLVGALLTRQGMNTT
jgi:hypothetical protein